MNCAEKLLEQTIFFNLYSRKLLTELGIRTEDAECKLMGDKCNFVIFVLIIKSFVGKYHPKTSNRHTGYQNDKPVKYKSLKAKEGITNASDNPNG